MPSPLLSLCADLRKVFLRIGYDAESLLELLGQSAHAALGRGEPVPVRIASSRGGPRGDGGDLGALVRLLLLLDNSSAAEFDRLMDPITTAQACAAGLVSADSGSVRASVDIRPVDSGFGTRWIVSDLDGSMRAGATSGDHVLGVGQASLSLLRSIPTAPTGTFLDVGTGCGIQAVHGANFAQHVTAVDISERSIALAACTLAINDIDVELRQGSWFEPVAGLTFDTIVANPPFVVGLPEVRHTYRDSGLDLDGASRLMISSAPEHLTLGGTATLLASWVHVEGGDWRSRVSSWLPDHGVDAWVVQRDVADPALYVGTWMQDEAPDSTQPDVAVQAQKWLEHFEASRVDGIGFGFVYLRKTDTPTDVLAEDLAHGFSDPLGSEALAYFDRVAWLRENSVASGHFVLDPSTALERVFLPDADRGGWQHVVSRVHRGNGPQWQHEIDDLGASMLAGMREGGLSVEQLAALLAHAHREDSDLILDASVELVSGLFRHGLVQLDAQK